MRRTTPTGCPTNLEAEHQRNRNAAGEPGDPGRYPPGSTFKVVTAAAGLDSGAITPETTIDAPGSLEVEGTPLENDFGEDLRRDTLDTALTNSVNTWFGQLGQQLGNDTLFEYMERFGFNAKPAIDLPEDELERAASSTSKTDELLIAKDPVDLARVAIGQERLLATPLQMARGRGRGRQRGRADEAADLEAGGRPRRPHGRHAWTPRSTAKRSAPKPRKS